jgi:hypothetical protein
MLTYALAVLAACANGISSVLQRKANKQVPQRQNLSLRLVWSLLHEPVWFGGIVALTVGFLLQASALGTGQLSLVEPVLVLELPVTLVLSSRVFGQRLGLRGWLPAAGMTAGLGGLLYWLAPYAHFRVLGRDGLQRAGQARLVHPWRGDMRRGDRRGRDRASPLSAPVRSQLTERGRR